MATFKNTNIFSRLEEILSERYSNLGCDQPVEIGLWDQNTLWARFLGLFNRAPQVNLTVRFSSDSGFTLDGPAWKEIKMRLNCSSKEFGHRIIGELRDLWELTHGWESSLTEDLQGLEEL